MKTEKHRKKKPTRALKTEGNPDQTEEQPTKKEGEGFLFDPYWDEEFSAYFDPTLKTCCQLKY